MTAKLICNEQNIPQFISTNLINITDTGIGIDSENLEKIFTPFERIGAEGSILEGTGLGLAVVKQLANLMQGKVGVSCELGVGSTFWICIIEPKKIIMNKDLLNAKILIVDEQESNIEVLEDLLTIRGFTDIITSNDPRAVLEIART
jgi:hypothetical protein